MKTKTFDVKITLTCVEEDMSGSWCEVHGDSVTAESIQNELRSWLGDLGFSVEVEQWMEWNIRRAYEIINSKWQSQTNKGW